MPQDKNAVDSFLGDIKEEKSPFANQEVFTEPLKEEEGQGTEDVGDEKPLPFHKDPKVQNYVKKQIEKALQGVSTKSEAQRFIEDTKGDEPSELYEALVGVIGNDTPEKLKVLKAFDKRLGELETSASEKAIARLADLEAEQRQEDVKAQEELDAGFEEIEETFNVDLSSNSPSAKKTRSEFVDFVRQVAPKNEDGEVTAFPDLIQTYELYQERNQKPNPTVTRAKQLASRSMQRSNDATQQPKGGSSWKDVERLFSRLG